MVIQYSYQADQHLLQRLRMQQNIQNQLKRLRELVIVIPESPVVDFLLSRL